MCLHATSRLSAPFAVSLQQGWTADNTASVINSFPVLSGPATDFFCSNIIVVVEMKREQARTHSFVCGLQTKFVHRVSRQAVCLAISFFDCH